MHCSMYYIIKEWVKTGIISEMYDLELLHKHFAQSSLNNNSCYYNNNKKGFQIEWRIL